MTREISKGKCAYCDRELSKSAMTSHLKSCKQRAASIENTSSTKSQKTALLHLVVEGQYLKMYWMHLEVPANTTLVEMDGFLRDIWLECCGHLSAFTIDGVSYKSHLDPQDDDNDTEDEFLVESRKKMLEHLRAQITATHPPEHAAELMELVQVHFSESPRRPIRERSMNVELGQVLKAGQKFAYEYDFGSTTHLTLKVVDEREGLSQGRAKKAIKIMARNEPPVLECELCDKTAAGIYTDWEGDVLWLCKECGKKQRKKEYWLPVVNSPRVGVCGYAG